MNDGFEWDEEKFEEMEQHMLAWMLNNPVSKIDYIVTMAGITRKIVAETAQEFITTCGKTILILEVQDD